MGLFKFIRRLILHSINLELELLIKKFQPQQVLEIGCGYNSPFINLINKHRINCVGLDIDPRVVARLKKSTLYSQVILADATKIPLKGGIFDMVIIGFVLHGVTATNRATIILEARRVLKNNGLLIIIDVCAPTSWFGRYVGLWCGLEEKLFSKFDPNHYHNYQDFLKNNIEGIMADKPTNLTTKNQERLFWKHPSLMFLDCFGCGLAMTILKSTRQPTLVFLITKNFECYARSTYSPLSVLMTIMSPCLTNKGT